MSEAAAKSFFESPNTTPASCRLGCINQYEFYKHIKFCQKYSWWNDVDKHSFSVIVQIGNIKRAPFSVNPNFKELNA